MHQPAHHRDIELPVERAGEESHGLRGLEATDLELRQARKGVRSFTRLADRDEEDQALGVEASSDERQELLRLAIEPLRIVDDAEHGCLHGKAGEQCQNGEPDEETVGGARFDPTEGGLQRSALRRGKALGLAEDRQEEAMKPCEAQALLGLDAVDPQHPESLRLLPRSHQERRLADAGFAPQHEGPAHAAARRTEKGVRHAALRCSPDEFDGRSLAKGPCRRRPHGWWVVLRGDHRADLEPASADWLPWKA